MAKFSNFIFVFAGIILLFHIFGLLEGTTSIINPLFQLVTDPTNLKSSQFTSITILTVTSILAAAGTWLTRTTFKADLIIFAGLVPILFGFGWDLLLVYNIVAQTSKALALLIFSPLLVVYVLSVIDWWRGTTT